MERTVEFVLLLCTIQYIYVTLQKTLHCKISATESHIILTHQTPTKYVVVSFTWSPSFTKKEIITKMEPGGSLLFTKFVDLLGGH